MDKTELLMRRRNVLAFIKADPVMISIVREPTPTRNPNTGGYIKDPSAAPRIRPQMARIVQNVRRYTDGIVNTEAGDIPNSAYRLIGMHNLNIEVNDTFTWLGDNYKITGIHEARTESVFAAVDLLGKENRHGQS